MSEVLNERRRIVAILAFHRDAHRLTAKTSIDERIVGNAIECALALDLAIVEIEKGDVPRVFRGAKPWITMGQ